MEENRDKDRGEMEIRWSLDEYEKGYDGNEL